MMQDFNLNFSNFEKFITGANRSLWDRSFRVLTKQQKLPLKGEPIGLIVRIPLNKFHRLLTIKLAVEIARKNGK